MPENRKLCKYPMSQFYIYEDQVPDGDRVCTPEDCEKCMEENCDDKHCLISGEHEDKFPPLPVPHPCPDE